MPSFYHFMLALTLALLTSGCGSGFDAASPTAITGGGSGAPYTDAQQAFLDSAVGSWESNCAVVTGDAVIQSLKQSMHITQTGIAVNYMLFTDSTCSFQTGLVTKSLSILRIGNSGPGGYGYQYSSYGYAGSVYAMSAGVAANFNARSVCGQTTWANGSATTWTGKSCEVPTGKLLVEASQSHGIMAVDTSVTPNTLVFGDPATGAGTSAGTRPAAYDSVIYYTKY